jgi:UDP-N-acetylglucosamine:LPS N-acetylglucosamine transferase
LKKIVIFTCIGGHSVVSQALADHLQKTHTVSVKNIFKDILWSIDPLKIITCGFVSAEDAYSLCIHRRWYSFMNRTYKNFIRYADLRKNKVKKLFKNAIIKEQADIIISVIPFFNNYFLEIAKELEIPFILMPTDIDAKTFVYNLPEVTYSKFRLAIALDSPEIREEIHCLKLLPEQIHVTGAALKEAFFKKHDSAAIKKRFNIPEDKPVILLLMGSQGSLTIIDFIKQLKTIENIPFHLIVVLGTNAHQYTTLSQFKFAPHVSTTFFGFTPLIPELMSISSLLITKSGGISICEALYMNLPSLFDATSEILVWEQLNQAFMQKNRFGTSVYHLEELSEMVRAFLTTQKGILNYYQHNMAQFPKKNGAQGIKELVDQLLAKTND